MRELRLVKVALAWYEYSL